MKKKTCQPMKTKWINTIWLVAGLFLFVVTVQINAQEAGMGQANQLLQNKQYEAASEKYTSLINEGNEGLSLFYNQGIAQYELSNYPLAILYFEKALKLDPNNKAVQHNLGLANKKLDQEFIEVESFFLKRWWNAITLFMGLPAWTILLFVVLFLTLIAFYFYLFGDSPPKRKLGMRSFYPLVLFSFVLLLIVTHRYHLRTDDSQAIILDKVALHEGADARSELLYELRPGTKIKILDSIQGWIKIELINKEVGWMKEEGFERI